MAGTGLACLSKVGGCSGRVLHVWVGESCTFHLAVWRHY
jgi:hypothetical protein